MNIGATILFLFLAVIGTPLFAVMGASSLFGFWRAEIDLQAVLIEFHQLAFKPMLNALPLFAFAGCLLGRRGASIAWRRQRPEFHGASRGNGGLFSR